MSQSLLRYGVLTSIPVLALVLCVAGCGTSVSQSDTTAASAAASSRMPAGCGGCCEPRFRPAVADDEANSSENEDLAKLSPEDRVLAEKQKTCPVTDAPLGSMGVPLKVTIKGQTVFLCCAGCEEKINSQADQYLAKMKGTDSK